jgi:hypothetical protein
MTNLPETFTKLLTKNSFSIKNVVLANHFSKDGIFFSEHKLRKIGKKKIKVCSPKSCVLEYIPFLQNTLNDNDTIISFIPFSCKIPILYSALQYIESQNRRVDLFHIFYDPVTKKKEISFLNKHILTQEYIEQVEQDFRKMDLLSK